MGRQEGQKEGQTEPGFQYESLLETLEAPVRDDIREMTRRAMLGEAAACRRFHRFLSMLNRNRYYPSELTSPRSELLLQVIATYMESQWLTAESSLADSCLGGMSDYVETARNFLDTMEEMANAGTREQELLWLYLCERVGREDFGWVLQQDFHTDTAMMDWQVVLFSHLAPAFRLELGPIAQETGPFDLSWNLSGRPFRTMMAGLGRTSAPPAETLSARGHDPDSARRESYIWQTLASTNLMHALIHRRCYLFQAMGAIAASWISITRRGELYRKGLIRLGLKKEQMAGYLQGVETAHTLWQEWRAKVLQPMLEKDMTLYRPFAEGLWMRLHAEAIKSHGMARLLGVGSEGSAAAERMLPFILKTC